MNIDVKNALDRVLSACEKIKSISTKDKGFRLITEYVVEDIYDFDYYLEWLISNKPDNFANGREMRNLFETMYSNQANRLADELIISDDALTSLTVADLPQFVLERSRE